MAKKRVYELAKDFGVDSKTVLDKLKDMGEFVKSASSTVEAPVARKLKNAFQKGEAKPGASAAEDTGSRTVGASCSRSQARTCSQARSGQEARRGTASGGTALCGACCTCAVIESRHDAARQSQRIPRRHA